MNTLIPFLAFAICLAYVQAGQCPDGSMCPDGSTCCKLATDEYGCCPYPSAICCNSYNCDVAHGKCVPKSLLAAIHSSESEMRTKIPAIKKTVVDFKDCPMGHCLEGCCPIPNTVCCFPFCCPSGYTCVGLFCVPPEHESEPMIDLDLTKLEEQVEFCPSGQTECPGGCCPLPDAVCCSDNTHCCPAGKFCLPPFCFGLYDKSIKFTSIPLKK